MGRFDNIVTGGTAVGDLSFSPNGERLAVCFEQTILLIAVEDSTIIHHIDNPVAVAAIAFSPDGKQLAAACNDGNLRIFDVVQGQMLATMQGEGGGYDTVAWSPNGQTIAAGHYEPWVDVFDALMSQMQLTLDPNIFDDEGRTCVLFSKDGTLLISTAYNTILLWSLPALTRKSRVSRKKLSLRRHAHLIDAAFSPDGRTIAGLAEVEGVTSLHLWDIETKKQSGHIKIPHYGQRLVWSPDSTFIAIAEFNGNGVSLWNPRTLERANIILEGSGTHNVRVVAIHPDGTLIIAGTEAGAVVGWNTLTGRQI